MGNPDIHIENIIIRFLDGSITIPEKEELLQWIKSSEENKKEILRIYKTWNLSKAALFDFEDKMAFQQLLNDVDTYNRNHKRLFRKRVIYWVSGVAACIALFVFAIPFFQKDISEESGILSFISQSSKPEMNGKEKAQLILSDEKTLLLDDKDSDIHYGKSDIKVNDQESISKEEVSEFNQLIVPFGKKSSITFSDGTKAWVNAGTRLVYPVEFDKKIREVYVDGEIYIEVIPNRKHPFVVKTKGLDITVLGTKFNVKAYETDQVKNVTLASGAIKINSDSHDVVLIPNQQYTYNEKDGSNKIIYVDSSEYTLWVKGLYLFKSEKLHTITNYLSKYHGVEIVCDESAANLRYSGKLDLENDLDIILQHITYSLSVTFEKTNDTYIIKMKK